MTHETRKTTVVRDFEGERRAHWGRFYWIISVGESIVRRLLPRSPLAHKPRAITQEEASGMTVYQRLDTCGLFDDFHRAVVLRDEAEMARILEAAHSPPEEIRRVLEQHRYKTTD